ncbi:MAG: type II restriction endonuclease [Sulfurovum sp.]|nr:type II restriction endonuclease [Sulfurovum sp.]
MSIQDVLYNSSLTQVLETIEYKGLFWIIKRLSGNDTGLTGGHQAGVYYPKSFFKKAFSELIRKDIHNPKETIAYCNFPNMQTVVYSLQVTYYNNIFYGGTRNEFRITNWGGKRSPTNDIENTGSIFLFAIDKSEESTKAVGWIASSIEEEKLIEEWIGEEVEPGRFYMPKEVSSVENLYDMPQEWMSKFPKGEEIFAYIVEKVPQKSWKKSLDLLLLKRREMEFNLYRQLEENIVFPFVKNGFDSVDEFLKLALSVSNRRKSRTGKSLELNLEAIFREEKLYFDTQAQTENGKKPDFLFPSSKAYHDTKFPMKNLKLVAAKTTCKDRWRQVLDEAERIEMKHLFTLQEGVSPKQFKQMEASRIQLVVPQPNLKSYPKEFRDRILTLDGLVQHIRENQNKIDHIEKWLA